MQMIRLKSLDEVQKLPLTEWKIRQHAEGGEAANDEDALNSGNYDDLMRRCDRFLSYLCTLVLVTENDEKDYFLSRLNMDKR